MTVSATRTSFVPAVLLLAALAFPSAAAALAPASPVSVVADDSGSTSVPAVADGHHW